MRAKRIAKQIWLAMSTVRLIPHMLFLAWHPSKACIEVDIKRWSDQYRLPQSPADGSDAHRSCIYPFIQLMTFYPEYRNVFYYRLGWTSKALYPLCRPMPLLSIDEVDEGIGPGFLIMHGRASGVAARKIGKDCTIYHHVSIGHRNETDKPILGDNVTIFAGAKVLGKVKIGDNAMVGANAVVVKDVPDNCTVVGVPAYIVRRNGTKVKEPL